MNKLCIVLLAVCLVSVHAFVKRDAETPAPNANDMASQLKAQIEGFSKDISAKITEAMNPDQIKKGFNDFVDNVNKAIDDLKHKAEAPKQ